jgi:hypothetical protein
MLETLRTTRYLTPLREGGSLPALVEAEDDGIYVLKFRGAGQGVKALIAEIISGEIARALGLPVPRLAFMQLDPLLGANEPDYEIRTLITTSGGVNLGMDYLPGSISFDPAVNKVDAKLASAIVWLDAFTTNVDRTARNTNMLMWHKKLYLIDHGASLYFHHQWPLAKDKYNSPFDAIKNHVLLRYASEIESQAIELKSGLTPKIIREIVSIVPDEWLVSEPHFKNVAEHREAYVDYLLSRLGASAIFEQEAISARAKIG